MKIVKINDHLKINIEMIYSLERRDNKNDIDEWNNNYSKYLEELSKDPPLLTITDTEVFQPKFGETNNESKMKLYGEALNNYILSIIGTCPTYMENYFIILVTGLKINIDKVIYDAIDEYLNKFIDK